MWHPKPLPKLPNILQTKGAGGANWIQNQTMAAVNNVSHRKADPETAVFKAAPKQLNSTSEKMEATNNNKSGTTTTPQK